MPLAEASTESRAWCFEELREGQEFGLGEIFDADAFESFARLSGDYSPLHTSATDAMRLGFPDRVVYGFHCLALLSRLVAVYFHDAICVSVEADFTTPAFLGDRIELTAQINKLQASMRTATLKIRMLRNDCPVIRGKLTIKFLP